MQPVLNQMALTHTIFNAFQESITATVSYDIRTSENMFFEVFFMKIIPH